MTNKKETERAGIVFSRLDYAAPIKYKGEVIMISPRAKLQVKSYKDLDIENFPKGITARAV